MIVGQGENSNNVKVNYGDSTPEHEYNTGTAESEGKSGESARSDQVGSSDISNNSSISASVDRVADHDFPAPKQLNSELLSAPNRDSKNDTLQSMATVPFLSEHDVRQKLSMEKLIDVMEQALKDFSAGGVQQPVRQVLPVAPAGGFFGTMPVVGDAMGVKMVSWFPRNAEKGIHTHHAMIALFDPKNGKPIAIMDGRLITEMRTSAVSAVATRLLAPPNASKLAIIGSGVQARSHVKALQVVGNFTDIRVWSPTAEHAQAFAKDVGATVFENAKEAVAGADVIVTATAATEPVLKGDWIKAGAHINAVGACRPNMRELDDGVMGNRLYVDSRDAAMTESGDVIGSNAEIYCELGEALQNSQKAHSTETSVFKSLGMAIEDIAAAQLVYQAYKDAVRDAHS